MEELTVEFSVDDVISVISNVTSPFVVISELIKNGVDANASEVKVDLDTLNGCISIKDNGDGFTREEIMELAKIAQSSKKRGGYLENSRGNTLLGSKGLAIYSVFSLGKKLEIWSYSDDGNFHVSWEMEDGLFYEELPIGTIDSGTVVIISEIEIDDMVLLSSDKELNKFKHISMNKFVDDMSLTSLVITKNGENFDISVDNITTFESDFDVIISFEYNSDENSLTYSYATDDVRVTSDDLVFDLNSSESVDSILEQKYQFDPVEIKFDDYLTGGLVHLNEIAIPHFEGKWYVKKNRKTNQMNSFESGIRLYVNKFALYNYLNKNNDWLQLTNISQTKKINDLRQHNVYGYVSFDNFNDLSEGLRISNERGGFIENKYYHKFIDILYNYILYPSISINLAVKNGLFVERSETIQNQEEEEENDSNVENRDSESDNEESIDDNTTVSNDPPSPESSGQVGSNDPDSNEIKILKMNSKEIEAGEQLLLKDSELIEEMFIDGITIIHNKLNVDANEVVTSDNLAGEYPVEYCWNGHKEILYLTIKNREIINNREGNYFFRNSNHFVGDIDLSDINELVHQLYDLDYDNKYLLFIISFRAIFEDITKSYIGSRTDLSLMGQLKLNVEKMIDDLIEVIVIAPNDALKDKKIRVHKKFKGRDALKNFLTSIKVKFSNESYDQFLHSLTHNPAKIDKELALEISNDIILPLYVLIKCLRDESII